MVLFFIRLIARATLSNEWRTLRVEILRRRVILATQSFRVPPLIAQRLLVSAEDHRHGRHGGIDFYAICRAVWRRFAQGRREGASTIEQQIVRVLTNRFERTLARKVRELLLATLVSEQLPKSTTPALYLSIGYYGWRMNGFAQACRRLGLKPVALSLDEAAALVARLKYPEARVPPSARLAQIHCRAEHLKHLYLHHLTDGTYKHLGATDAGETIRTPARVSESLHAIS
jgi:membrane peptidoglycan carboxypeptidase